MWNHNCSISVLVYLLGSSQLLPRTMMEKLHLVLLLPGLRLLLTRMRTRKRGSRGANIAVGEWFDCKFVCLIKLLATILLLEILYMILYYSTILRLNPEHLLSLLLLYPFIGNTLRNDVKLLFVKVTLYYLSLTVTQKYRLHCGLGYTMLHVTCYTIL